MTPSFTHSIDIFHGRTKCTHAHMTLIKHKIHPELQTENKTHTDVEQGLRRTFEVRQNRRRQTLPPPTVGYYSVQRYKRCSRYHRRSLSVAQSSSPSPRCLGSLKAWSPALRRRSRPHPIGGHGTFPREPYAAPHRCFAHRRPETPPKSQSPRNPRPTGRKRKFCFFLIFLSRRSCQR